MKWYRILIDPSFWILLGVNIFLAYRYEQNPKIFTTLLWLYWSQNVLFGVFNFFDIVTLKKIDLSGSVWAEKSTKSEREIVNYTAWGFAFMFGFFHFVLLVFVATMAKTGPFDWHFYKTYLLVFFIFQVINFIQHKLQNRDKAANISNLSLMPFWRVVPLHLCILIPAFLKVSNLMVFIILKVIVDIITYVLTTRYYQKDNAMPEVTVINIDSTLSE